LVSRHDMACKLIHSHRLPPLQTVPVRWITTCTIAELRLPTWC